ncbi:MULTISPECIES: hypothetical protein [Streptosporangiaceae]|uniref:hypothetical protein n=1 Tax=Streptosporangiaceae TaxID=2004 RepID=UPI00340E9B5E
MAETPGLDALAAGLRSELGPPVEELNALNLAPERMTVKELLWTATFLQGEVKRLRAALENLIPAAHDLDSTKCRERAARQEKLSPRQQSVGEWDDECPACEALILLKPGVRRG